jgi:hypothetical protein
MKATFSACLVVLLVILTAVLAAHSEHREQELIAGEHMAPIVSLVAKNDIELKNGNAKYKYKAESSADAQQKIKLTGKCPTGLKDFNTIQSFNVRCRYAGQPDAINDTFGTPTGVQGKQANRYKQRFTYFKAAANEARSKGGHKLPSYGRFKAWLKGDNLYFVYALNKMNEGGMMAETANYQDLKGVMAESNKVSSTANLEGAVNVATWVTVDGEQMLGTESHDLALQAKYKANQKAGKAKYFKQ